MAPTFKCLILEDDFSLADALIAAVELNGGEAIHCATLEHAKTVINAEVFQVFILDNYLPDGTGGAFFSHLREQGILSPCIMLTGRPEIETAVKLTRNGLFDYLIKPLDTTRFTECLKRALFSVNATESSLKSFGVIDCSPAMKRVRQLVYQAAANPSTTVLLTGETGVGKDVVARLVHQLTFQHHESAPPMISLNCSTLPMDMFEAELFGAQKGAYTGAHQNRVGLGEAAKGGTLFLDEIAEVPLLMQAKLLRFLESGEFRRLGSTASIKFEGRIIAATNKSLEKEVRQNRFREDLWYRLDVFNIHIPALRERKEDIAGLVEVLLETISKKCQRTKPLIKPEDLILLNNYECPGNVRELRNILERSLIQTPTDARWLQLDSTWKNRSAKSNFLSVEAVPEVLERDLTPIEKQEYLLVKKALNESGGSIRQTASKLGLSHQALLRRLEKWPELRK